MRNRVNKNIPHPAGGRKPAIAGTPQGAYDRPSPGWPRLVTPSPDEHDAWSPYDHDAEREVLGAMLTDADSIREAQRAGLTEAAFHWQRHRLICRTLYDCADSDGLLVDVVSALEKRDELAAVGGKLYLATLMEHAVATKSAPANVRKLLELKRRRDALEASRTLADLMRSPGDTPIEELLAQSAATLQRLAGGSAGAVDLVAGAQRFMQREVTPEDKPEPILGDSLLSRGELAVFAGKGGEGKSRLAQEMAVACARGEQWLEFSTGKSPLRVGYFAAEFSRYRWQHRLLTLFGDQTPPDDPAELQAAYRGLELTRDCGALVVITGEDVAGVFPDLTTAHGAMQLEALILEHRLDLLVLDPLGRLLGGKDETNETFRAVVAWLDRVRIGTRCAILLVHHERKASTDKRAQDDDLDAGRGGTVLRDSANTWLRLVRSTGGLRQLRFPKANYARTPEPLYLRIPEDGGRTALEQAPEAKGDANRAKVLAWAQSQSGRFTAKEAAKALKLSDRTCRDHLSALAEAGQIERHADPRGALSWSIPGGRGNDTESLLDSSWKRDGEQ